MFRLYQILIFFFFFNQLLILRNIQVSFLIIREGGFTIDVLIDKFPINYSHYVRKVKISLLLIYDEYFAPRNSTTILKYRLTNATFLEHVLLGNIVTFTWKYINLFFFTPRISYKLIKIVYVAVNCAGISVIVAEIHYSQKMKNIISSTA